MKIEVRVQSKSGNTKKVADVIAGEVGVEAKSVNVPLDGEVDLLFLGGAIYAGGLNRELKSFVKGLKPGQVKRIALFSTAAGTKGIAAKVEKLLKNGVELLGGECHIQSGALDAGLPEASAFAGRMARAGQE